MKKFHFLLLGVVLILSSCSSSTSDVVPIPKEASQVVNINTSTLSSHISLEELFSTSLFKKLESEVTDTSTFSILKNPSSSGLNTDKNFTFFSTYKNKSNVMVLGAFIANKDQFEKIVSTHIGSPIESKGYKYSIKEQLFVAWNDDIAIQGILIPGDLSQMNFENPEETITNDSADITSTITFFEEYFNAKGSDLINGHKHFKEALSLGGDIQTYSNTTYAMAPYQMYLSMSKIGDILKDNYTISNVNFENGKVVSKSKVFLNDVLKKLSKKHIKNNVNLDPLSNFGKEVVVGMAMEVSPEFYVDVVKEMGFEGMANSFLQQNGFSLDDIAQAFGKSMFGGLSDVIPVTYETRVDHEPQGAFGMEIKNKDVFKKIMNVFHSQGVNVFDSTLLYNDNLFVISSSQVLGNSILNGSGKEINEYAKQLKNTSGGFFVDVDKLIAIAQNTTPKEDEKKYMEIFSNYLKGGYANFELEGGDIVGHAVFELKNKNESSLKSLVKMLDELYIANEKNEAANMGTDSLVPQSENN